jgi:hypothetical protein
MFLFLRGERISKPQVGNKNAFLLERRKHTHTHTFGSEYSSSFVGF